jgi:hypothetical protein
VTNKQRAVVVLVAALAVGAIAQGVAKSEAAMLGLTTLELALVGFAVGAVALRLQQAS